MILKGIEYGYEINYLPNKRCRKARIGYMSATMDVEVKEVSETEFPVAFIVYDYASVYEGAKDHHDFKGNGNFRIFPQEIRRFNNSLYKAVHITFGAAISTLYEPLDYIASALCSNDLYKCNPEIVTEETVIVWNNQEKQKTYIQDKANEDFIVFDGKVWRKCGEPCYEVATFGLGNNHGGTGLFIKEIYKSDGSHFFNSLEFDDAVNYAVKIAANRGDTNDIERLKNTPLRIDVLIPEAVKLKSRKEYEKEAKEATNRNVTITLSAKECEIAIEALKNYREKTLANKIEKAMTEQ